MARQLDPATPVFIVGAGAMGVGIAQVAAQAGHALKIYDVSAGALVQAQAKLAASFGKLVSSGKLSQELASAGLGRIQTASSLEAASGSGLVIEAIVENLATKRELFQRLEPLVGEECVLASNTSSLSITALASGLRHPERAVGMHFFNPVTHMKLVEIVSGLRSAPATAESVFALARRWGKVPVHARSTPGFIVNRIARPFYAEALALLQERAVEPQVIDLCFRSAGFRMGPCELMDLIGHDVNLAVTEAVFNATFGDKRFVPSPVQRELVAAGFLGRKSGRGFFDYGAEVAATAPPLPGPPLGSSALPAASQIVLHGSGLLVERWVAALTRAGRRFERRHESAWSGLVADGAQLRLTDGRPAGLIAARDGVADLALFDLPLTAEMSPGRDSLAWAAARSASDEWQRLAPQWLAAAGWTPERIGDAAGLIVARTVAMLINEAADALLQGVCDADAADLAMKLAVNYPAGPFEWLRAWHVCDVVRLLGHLDDLYRGERYRVSLELRQRAWLCESRGHTRDGQPALN